MKTTTDTLTEKQNDEKNPVFCKRHFQSFWKSVAIGFSDN